MLFNDSNADGLRTLGAHEILEVIANQLIHSNWYFVMLHCESAVACRSCYLSHYISMQGLQSSASVVSLPYTSISAGLAVVDAVLACQLMTSKSEARRTIASGGLYLNRKRCVV